MKLKDKHGWGLDFITLFVVLFVVVVMLAITNTKDPALRQRQLDTAMTGLNWSKYSAVFALKPDDGSLSIYVINIVYKMVDAMGYCFMTVAKVAVNWAAANPELNWKLIAFLILLSLIAPILMFIIRFIVLIWILVFELIQRKKEREEKRKWFKIGI